MIATMTILMIEFKTIMIECVGRKKLFGKHVVFLIRVKILKNETCEFMNCFGKLCKFIEFVKTSKNTKKCKIARNVKCKKLKSDKHLFADSEKTPHFLQI